jgi:phage-related minor tail protein
MASKRIRGITIDIDGNVTKLSDSLKSVDTILSKTESNLKDVNRLLKLDPTNTELLSQKQKLLNDAIASTKKSSRSRKMLSKE